MSQKAGRSLRTGMMDGQTLSGNPTEDRRLAATLSKIDREKKKRESAMMWNQRSFFIKQVFDQDNELRFVKASQRPKYLENIPPAPADGDNSWVNEDYVFCFKPKQSPESKDNMPRRHSKGSLEDSPKAPEVDENTEPQEQAPPEGPQGEETKVEETPVEDTEQVERERKEKEKRELSRMGVFGAKREKLKMPLLMTGGWKTSEDSEKIVEEETVDENKKDEVAALSTDENGNTIEGLCAGDQSKSGLEQSYETPKPKTRFPILKVRALGLFAMTFKKNDSFPPLQQSPRQPQTQLQSQSTQDLQSSGTLLPATDVVSSDSVPPQTAPAAVAELPRPGSISLPNSPNIERKQKEVRPKSGGSMQVERPNTNQVQGTSSAYRKSRRGSRRSDTARTTLSDRSHRHSIDVSINSSSSKPNVKRDVSTKLPPPGNLPPVSGRESRHIWGKTEDTPDSDSKGSPRRASGSSDGKCQEEMEEQVIRRIVRTLPAHLMLKTSKREVEAGGDIALMRQRLMDRARADMTRRSALDPRFKKLENSLCNSSQ